MLYITAPIKFRGILKHLILYTIMTLDKAHGYELRRFMADMFKLQYMPSNGVLYPLLHELENEGLLTSYTDGKRKVYTLTKRGIKYVELNKEEIEATVKKIKYAFELLSQLNMDKLINILQVMWAKNIVLPNHIVENLRVKITEILDILNNFLSSIDMNQNS
ncbi:MAG: PadR family transcriptional regulator [Ignisphaera sp.]|uniref:PadR family transcriptional regulator n=1 Tax=Ignisphaera aggregans TaxID=334771 RepID=A0A7C4JIV4_9CREN